VDSFSPMMAKKVAPHGVWNAHQDDPPGNWRRVKARVGSVAVSVRLRIKDASWAWIALFQQPCLFFGWAFALQTADDINTREGYQIIAVLVVSMNLLIGD
jgi:hypothetical protein